MPTNPEDTAVVITGHRYNDRFRKEEFKAAPKLTILPIKLLRIEDETFVR